MCYSCVDFVKCQIYFLAMAYKTYWIELINQYCHFIKLVYLHVLTAFNFSINNVNKTLHTLQSGENYFVALKMIAKIEILLKLESLLIQKKMIAG